MKYLFTIRFPSSILFRLLLFVLPLVCVPIAILGYLSYRASVESVTRLGRDEQLLRVKAAATEVNHIFNTCYKDLDTLSLLIGEVTQSESVDTTTPSEISKRSIQERISKIFEDFVSQSPYYIRIHLFDALGSEIISTHREGQKMLMPGELNGPFSRDPLDRTHPYKISNIVFSKPDKAFIIRISTLLSEGGFIPHDGLVLDLNFSKLTELVTNIRIGKLGFAFVVDQSGRMIAHPLFDPYQYDLSKYDDPLLREVIVDMILHETGWRTYRQIQLYAVAFTPVTATGWSIALSLPMTEFNKEAVAARRKMIETVIIILAIAGSAASLLSYRIYRPVKNLVAATEKIARGDLRKEIPVRSGDELGTLAQHFNQVVRKLREIQAEIIRYEKLISMGKLSAGVAHEVRNPLNAMKGAIVYMQKRKSGDTLIQEYTQLMLEEINRLDKFVTRFLYFSKQSSPNFVYTDLNELIRETINFLKEEFRSKKIEISLHLEPSIPNIRIDPHQIEQVYLNLFVNAIHAMPDGGLLTISSYYKNDNRNPEAEQRVVSRIQDNGVGIPKDHFDHIYELFFSTKEDGTGLGLPISQGIIEDHWGSIEIFSQEGQGTTVIVELPLEKSNLNGKNRDEKGNFSR